MFTVKFTSFFLSIALFFISLFNVGGYKSAMKDLLSKTGGYITGICHPNEDYETLANANIGWVRFDIPFPIAEGGEGESHFYTEFKARAKGYKDNGFKVMAVTPYPLEYVNHGIDPRTPEGEAKVKELAVYMVNDLRDLVDGLQITNEMQGTTFAYPLTEAEGARFTGIQLEAIYPVRGNIIIGYNTAGTCIDYHKTMQPYLDYCDYVGLDIYVTSISEEELGLSYKKQLKKVFDVVKKPLIMQEFGFVSNGAAYSAERRAEILRSYGYNSEAEAMADDINFTNQLEPQFRRILERDTTDKSQWGDLVLTKYAAHFYGDMKMSDTSIPHTPEGAAKYFEILIPALFELDFFAGAIIYANCDMATCWACGKSDCPCETVWGICKQDGTPKPAYYAVKNAFAQVVSK